MPEPIEEVIEESAPQQEQRKPRLSASEVRAFLDERQRLEEAIQRRAESERELAKIQAQQTALRHDGAVNQAIGATGLKFYDLPSTKKLFASEFELVESDEGIRAQSKETGETLPIKDALRKFAERHFNFVESGLPENHAKPNGGIVSRDQLTSREARIKFISDFGLAAYEKLPATRPLADHELSWPAYQRLSFTEKARIVEKHGEAFIVRLRQRYDADAQQRRIDAQNELRRQQSERAGRGGMFG
jgi:hypothetical protein